MVFQLDDHLVYLGNEEAIFGVSVVFDDEGKVSPDYHDFFDLYENGVFAGSLSRDGIDCFEVILNTSFDQLVQIEIEESARWSAYKSPDIVPMLLLHCFDSKCGNQVSLLQNSLNLSLSRIQYLIFLVKLRS
jgi:hypothetical protein